MFSLHSRRLISRPTSELKELTRMRRGIARPSSPVGRPEPFLLIDAPSNPPTSNPGTSASVVGAPSAAALRFGTGSVPWRERSGTRPPRLRAISRVRRNVVLTRSCNCAHPVIHGHRVARGHGIVQVSGQIIAYRRRDQHLLCFFGNVD